MGSKQDQKVLVVDDEEAILELLKYNLEKQGYEVKTASDGLSAVDVAKKFVPDLILLDIMMPNQDGVETCRQLREVPDLHGAFIIFLTARAEGNTLRWQLLMSGLMIISPSRSSQER